MKTNTVVTRKWCTKLTIAIKWILMWGKLVLTKEIDPFLFCKHMQDKLYMYKFPSSCWGSDACTMLILCYKLDNSWKMQTLLFLIKKYFCQLNVHWWFKKWQKIRVLYNILGLDVIVSSCDSIVLGYRNPVWYDMQMSSIQAVR